MREKIKTCKQKNEEIEFLAERMATDLNETISTLKNNLISFDFTNMISYESKNEKCKDALKILTCFILFSYEHLLKKNNL